MQEDCTSRSRKRCVGLPISVDTVTNYREEDQRGQKNQMSIILLDYVEGWKRIFCGYADDVVRTTDDSTVARIGGRRQEALCGQPNSGEVE